MSEGATTRGSDYGADQALAFVRTNPGAETNVRWDWLVGWFANLAARDQWAFLYLLNDETLDDATLATLGIDLLDIVVVAEGLDAEPRLRRGMTESNFRVMASALWLDDGGPVDQMVERLVAEFSG